MARKMIALVLSGTLAAAGCASTGTARVSDSPSPAVRATLADYARRLPAGARVRVDRTIGSSIRGILLAAQDDRIVVQRATRIPEPPVDIPLSTVERIALETERPGFGKAVAIGAGVGAGAVLAFLAILAAAFAD